MVNIFFLWLLKCMTANFQLLITRFAVMTTTMKRMGIRGKGLYQYMLSRLMVSLTIVLCIVIRTHTVGVIISFLFTIDSETTKTIPKKKWFTGIACQRYFTVTISKSIH